MRKNNLCKCCSKLFFYTDDKEPDYCNTCSLKPDYERKPILRTTNGDSRLSRVIGNVVCKETGSKVSMPERLN